MLTIMFNAHLLNAYPPHPAFPLIATPLEIATIFFEKGAKKSIKTLLLQTLTKKISSNSFTLHSFNNFISPRIPAFKITKSNLVLKLSIASFILSIALKSHL